MAEAHNEITNETALLILSVRVLSTRAVANDLSDDKLLYDLDPRSLFASTSGCIEDNEWQ